MNKYPKLKIADFYINPKRFKTYRYSIRHNVDIKIEDKATTSLKEPIQDILHEVISGIWRNTGKHFRPSVSNRSN